jgi:molybdopterin converting factor subunit 1
VQITVRLFAGLRERAGADEIELELPDGATVADALAQLAHLADGAQVLLAVNREYAAPDVRLAPGDEVAMIPPVSGGSVAQHALVTPEPLEASRVTELVRDPRAGAVVVFEGVTREVEQLDYEAYADMAQAEIAEIVATAIERHGLCAAAAEHRIGVVPLSEPSVIVAASAPHREAAFAGAREIIDEIKAHAPIWKKEDGRWVEGVTPGRRLRRS